jgi:hypothetical protein
VELALVEDAEPERLAIALPAWVRDAAQSRVLLELLERQAWPGQLDERRQELEAVLLVLATEREQRVCSRLALSGQK